MSRLASARGARARIDPFLADAESERHRKRAQLIHIKAAFRSGLQEFWQKKNLGTTMTDTISGFLTEDHRRCDFLLAACEKALAAGDWEAADRGVGGFREALLHHFSLEENLLFPEVERANPAASGPTRVMRMEHAQMRQLLDDLSAAASERDRDTCLGVLETLHMIGQQHNSKEEGILYPLSDRSMQGEAVDLVRRMQAS